jgi:hypothetical protein
MVAAARHIWPAHGPRQIRYFLNGSHHGMTPKCGLPNQPRAPGSVAKDFGIKIVYKQSKFFQRIQTTQRMNRSVHPLGCFYPLELILPYSLVDLRRSFVGELREIEFFIRAK